MSTKKPMIPLELLVERVLSVIAISGLACLCIGFLLYMTGRASNSLDVVRIGVYILVIGIMLVAMRLLYWLAEKIVGREFKKLKQDYSTRCVLKEKRYV